MSGVNADIRGIVQAQSPREGIANTIAEAARQEGAIKGQTAVVIDQSSILANAAEEMGFAAAEKVEKKISERKAGSKEGMRLSMAELAAHFVNMTGDAQGAKKLQEFVDSMKNLGGAVTQDLIRQMVQEKFGDGAAEQFTALEYAEMALEQAGENSQLVDTIKATKEALLREAGPAIRAGINIVGEVLAFSREGLAQISSLKELYSFAILGRATASDMYKAVMDRYGEGRFKEALEFLLRAAGSDLDAGGMGPSQEKAHLETEVNNVCFVQHLGNLYEELEQLMAMLQPQHV